MSSSFGNSKQNKEGSSLLLLDVRTPDECKAGMIPGAKNIPCKIYFCSYDSKFRNLNALTTVDMIVDEVPRAFGISLPGVESETLDPQEFQDCYGFQRPDASDPEHRIEAIVVYCRSGYRSGIAQKMLAKQYSIPVINYVGSWLDWSSQQ